MNSKYITCKECGKEVFSSYIKKHLKEEHGLSMYDYGIKHNFLFFSNLQNDKYTLTEFNNKCNRCGGEFKLSIIEDTIQVSNCLTTRCNKERNVIGKAHQIFKDKTIVQKITDKYFEIQKSSAFSLKKCIEKYGEEEGRKRHKEVTDKTSGTLENFIKRHGEVEGKRRFDIFREKSAHTKEKYIQRFGEIEGLRKWNDFVNMKKTTSPRTLEYWLNKCGGDYEKAESMLSDYQGWTLEKSIEKYGEKEGRVKFLKANELKGFLNTKEGYLDKYGQEKGEQEWKKRSDNLSYKNSFKGLVETHGKEKAEDIMKSRLTNNSYSNASFLAFKEIEEKLGLKNSFYGEKEYYVTGKQEKAFFYWLDFFNKELNLAIEFYGDYWHCNPRFYKEGDWFNKDKKVKEIWEADATRISQIEEKLKTKVLIIWEYDWNKNKETILKQIEERLNV